MPPFAVKFVGAGVGGGAPLTYALVAVDVARKFPGVVIGSRLGP